MHPLQQEIILYAFGPPRFKPSQWPQRRIFDLQFASLDCVEIARPHRTQPAAQRIVENCFGCISKRRGVTPPDVEELIHVAKPAVEMRAEKELRVVGDD